MDKLQRQRFIMLMVWIMSIFSAILIAITVPVQSGLITAKLVIGGIPIVAVILWTGLIWFNHRYPQQVTPQKTILPENAPISYKMALLLEMMDEDEREALKQDLRRQVLGSDEAYRLQDMLEDDSMVEMASGKRKRG